MPLTTTECNNLLNASANAATYPNTTATKLGLVTAVGNATTAGTEVSGGSGPYARQLCPFSTAASGSIANSGTVTFTGMPACTVVGAEIWDSAGTPNRKWYMPLTASRTLSAGDSISFATSAVSLGLS